MKYAWHISAVGLVAVVIGLGFVVVNQQGLLKAGSPTQNNSGSASLEATAEEVGVQELNLEQVGFDADIGLDSEDCDVIAQECSEQGFENCELTLQYCMDSANQ